MASAVSDMTIDDAWEYAKAAALTAWSKTTRRMRAGLVVIFVYVYLPCLNILPRSPHLYTFRTLTIPKHIVTHPLPTHRPLLSFSAPSSHCLPRLHPRHPIPLQHLQSRPPTREPAQPNSRPPNASFHVGRSPRLALPLHGLPRIGRIDQ